MRIINIKGYLRKEPELIIIRNQAVAKLLLEKFPSEMSGDHRALCV